MKKLVKIGVSAAMIAAMAIQMIGCGQGKSGSDAQELEVYVWDAGYGTEWCTALLEDFSQQDWVKEKYPDLKYKFTSNDQNGYAEGRIGSGDINTVDLFFAGNLAGTFGESALDLTDVVYNTEVPGEDVLYKDKVKPYMLEALEYRNQEEGNTGKYYAGSYSSGMVSFVYNKTLFEDLGLTVPRTTEELYELCETVKNWEGKKAAYPYTHTIISSKIAYSDRLPGVWWSQYDGVDGYSNYFNAIAADGTKNSVDIFEEQGRMKSVKVFEKLYKEESGYYDRSSINYEFIQGQTRMLTGEGLMMVCGEWFSTEMRDLAQEYAKKGYNYEIGMMHLPVISDIIEKTSTITNDEMLRQVITDVDEGKSAASDPAVSAEDFERVKEARGVFAAPDAVTSHAVIPNYADAKDIAVDFLRYMATDRANSIYAEKTYGGMLPFDFDLKEDNPELYKKLQEEYAATFCVMADVAEIINTENARAIFYYSPLVKYGGFNAWLSKYDCMEIVFMSDKDMTAEQIIKESDDYWLADNAKRFQEALRKSGMQ